MENAKKLIEETLRLRAEATQGEWEFNCSLFTSSRIWLKIPDEALYLHSDVRDKPLMSENTKLICHSANNIEKLCKALEVALDTLNAIVEDSTTSNPRAALRSIEKIESIIVGGGG